MPKIKKQLFGELLRVALALQLTLFLFSVVYADVGPNLKHNVDKNVKRNTYVNGQDVIVKFEYSPAIKNNVTYHWQNYRGEKITEPMLLKGANEAVIPVPEGRLPRYMGLVFQPVSDVLSLPGREPGEAKEYGFAIFPDALPEPTRPDPDRWMGMVHVDQEDPWLSGWVKTLTWQTTSPEWWHTKIEKRRAMGNIELPIISGGEWKSDDYRPVESDQLARIESRARAYFAADPGTVYWETGIEENLGGRFKRPYYLANLAAKSAAVRAAADDVNPDIKLIFQIANIKARDVGIFMQSNASQNYDILSLHPYNWPDFPPPEEWLSNYLEKARSEMRLAGRVLPVWVTEIGAPHRGNCLKCFFGYPKDNKSVPGLTNPEMISYLIKFQVIAFHDDVEKIFWYNYKDRGPDREFAEDHFGLIDFWGYPKPAYLAYVNMSMSLADKAAAGVVRKNDIWAYRFAGESEDVIVAWSFPARSAEVSLADLGIALSSDENIRVTNAIGDPIAIFSDQIFLLHEPVFIHVGGK